MSGTGLVCEFTQLVAMGTFDAFDFFWFVSDFTCCSVVPRDGDPLMILWMKHILVLTNSYSNNLFIIVLSD